MKVRVFRHGNNGEMMVSMIFLLKLLAKIDPSLQVKVLSQVKCTTLQDFRMYLATLKEFHKRLSMNKLPV